MTPVMVILCPLAHEARHARAAAMALHARVVVTGPGPDAARAAVEHAVRQGAVALILFGTCGSLTPAPRVPLVARVMDESGASWECQARVHSGASSPALTLVGVDRPVTSPMQKAELRRRTGADLVDCESHAFARACTAAGVRWGIIRAVSDGPNDSLPSRVADWIARDGSTRLARVVWDCVCSPGLIVPLVRLSRTSNAALREASEALREAVGGASFSRHGASTHAMPGAAA